MFTSNSTNDRKNYLFNRIFDALTMFPIATRAFISPKLRCPECAHQIGYVRCRSSRPRLLILLPHLNDNSNFTVADNELYQVSPNRNSVSKDD